MPQGYAIDHSRRMQTEAAANGCARSTVKETYEFILGDLNKAIELLTANTKKTRSDKRYVSLGCCLWYTCSCSPDYAQLCRCIERMQKLHLPVHLRFHTSSAAVSKPTFIDIEDASWMWGILITDTRPCKYYWHL